MPEHFAGTVAVVTGGGSGIGAACAAALAEVGVQVAVLDREAEAAASVADAISRYTPSVSVSVDVSDPSAITRAFTVTRQKLGQLNFAINCAGTMGAVSDVADYSLDAWAQVLNVNLTGTFLCMQAELQLMAGQDGCAIVNIASVAGLRGIPAMAAYTASKHGVVGLTKSAALDYAARGVRINVVCPGPIETPMLHEFLAAAEPQVGGEIPSPTGRLGQAHEVAATAIWLCSPSATYVIGQAIAVDGGTTAGG